jgi:hypothetical protein
MTEDVDGAESCAGGWVVKAQPAAREGNTTGACRVVGRTVRRRDVLNGTRRAARTRLYPCAPLTSTSRRHEPFLPGRSGGGTKQTHLIDHRSKHVTHESNDVSLIIGFACTAIVSLGL